MTTPTILLRCLSVSTLLVAACSASHPATPPPSASDPQARLDALGIVLPEPGAPVANYVQAVRTGNLVFLAGKGPSLPGGGYVTGKLGADLTVEQGYEAARLTAIQHLAVLQAELGDLRRVRRVVKVLGAVNCTPEFTDQPAVINGYSDLMAEVFGEAGRHARAAVGSIALPLGASVEVEMVLEEGTKG